MWVSKDHIVLNHIVYNATKDIFQKVIYKYVKKIGCLYEKHPLRFELPAH